MVTASEVLTSPSILAVPVGALIGFAIAENRYFAEGRKTAVVFRLQHSEIDLPAAVHPGVRPSVLLAKGRFRVLLQTIFIVIIGRRRRRWSPSRVEHLTIARSYGATPLQKPRSGSTCRACCRVLLEALRIRP